MSKLTAKVDIGTLVDTLIGHNYNYYVLDKPSISDADWDAKFHQLKALEAEYPSFIRKDSPTQTVGHAIVAGHFSPMRHRFPMLSLDNSLTDEALIDWTIDISEHKDCEAAIEWKMDGLSVDLLYFRSRLIAAITRGDGIVGENVFLNALQIKSIPKELAGKYDQDWVSVRGEIVVNLPHYHKLNAELIANGKAPYANPRNYAAGSLRQKDPDVTGERGLEFYCYSVTSEPQVYDHWSKERQFMLQNGFLTTYTDVKFNHSHESKLHSNIPTIVNRLQALRSQLPFEVDGLVIKVMCHKVRDALGYTSKFPRWATAYKFPATEGHTELLDIEYQIGRTGKATPVARIAPVSVHGTTISNVTLHNRSQIKRLNLYKGCHVIVRRAGDVIPQIVGTVAPWSIQELYTPLTECPCCGSKTSIRLGIDGAEQDYCDNVECYDRKLAYLNYLTERKVLNIKGLGEATVKKLFDAGYIKTEQPFGLLTLSKYQFSQVGESELMCDKLHRACRTAAENLTLVRVIIAFGLSGAADGTAERLARHFQTLPAIAKATEAELIAVKDIGGITAESIFNFFDNDNAKPIEQSAWRRHLSGNGLPAPEPIAVNADWVGRSVVVTGSNFGGKKRKDIEAFYKQLGASIASDVSSTTKLVLCGTKYTSRKLANAKAKNVDYKVYDESGVIETNIVEELQS